MSAGSPASPASESGGTDLRLARAIDHTLLRPDCTAEQVRKAVGEAAELSFAAVCLPPVYVADAARELAGTLVHTCTVVGFPLGYVEPGVRVAESLRAVAQGAQELDTVLNLSWLKSREEARVLDDLAGWVRAMRAERADLVLKVIVETSLLSEEEKLRAAELVLASGADFIKTSTGFAQGGATVADVALLAGVAGGRLRVKASGGIRDAATARALLAAGASRLGTSHGVAIVRGDPTG